MDKHNLIATLALLKAELQEKNIIIEHKAKENRLLQKQNKLLQVEGKFTLRGRFVVFINTFLLGVICAINIVSTRKHQGQDQKMREDKERKSKIALHKRKSKGCECRCNSRDKKHQGHKGGLRVANVRFKEEIHVLECKVRDQTEKNKSVKVCTFKVKQVHPTKETERRIMYGATHLPCQGLQSDETKSKMGKEIVSPDKANKSKLIEKHKRHIKPKELSAEPNEQSIKLREQIEMIEPWLRVENNAKVEQAI
eukprot:15364599-Ditylum_brightwellii.AAC.8